MFDLTRVKRNKGDDTMTAYGKTAHITSLHLASDADFQAVSGKYDGERRAVIIIEGANEVQVWVNKDQAERIGQAFMMLFDEDRGDTLPMVEEDNPSPIDPELNDHLNTLAN